MIEPNWKNRTLWTGDNLDFMRGMNSESVDLIYLDPPFDSNRDYSAPIGSEAAGAAFKDTWTLDDVGRSLARRSGRQGTHDMRHYRRCRLCPRQRYEILSDYDGRALNGNEAAVEGHRFDLSALRCDRQPLS